MFIEVMDKSEIGLILNKKIIDRECLKKYSKRLSPNSLIKKLLW